MGSPLPSACIDELIHFVICGHSPIATHIYGGSVVLRLKDALIVRCAEFAIGTVLGHCVILTFTPFVGAPFIEVTRRGLAPSVVFAKCFGVFYKTQKSYQCFAKPTNTDNGKVLGVVNGTPTWVDASSSDEEYGGENANIPYIITGKSGKIDDDVIYEKLMAGKKDLLYVTDNSDIVIMNGASSLSNDTAYYLVGQNTDACGRHIIYQMLLDSNRNWVVTVNAVGKLSGRSDELTPQDVYTALEEGSAIAVVHTDTTYGTVWFNCFSYSQLAGVVSSVVFETGISRMCAQLIGDISQNTWTFTAFDLSSSSGVPNEGAINSLIDRKIADVTTLIQEQLGVIENGTY